MSTANTVYFGWLQANTTFGRIWHPEWHREVMERPGPHTFRTRQISTRPNLSYWLEVQNELPLILVSARRPPRQLEEKSSTVFLTLRVEASVLYHKIPIFLSTRWLHSLPT